MSIQLIWTKANIYGFTYTCTSTFLAACKVGGFHLVWMHPYTVSDDTLPMLSSDILDNSKLPIIMSNLSTCYSLKSKLHHSM